MNELYRVSWFELFDKPNYETRFSDDKQINTSGNRLYYFARIANSQRVGWYIFYDDTTGPNHAVVAYRHPGQYAYIAANPYVVAYRNWMCVFQAFVSFRCVQRMSGGVESAIWRDKHVVAKRDGSRVEIYDFVV